MTTITLVNACRIIFDYYFDTGYEILPDRPFFLVEELCYYQFLDVSSQAQNEYMKEGMEYATL